MKTLVVYDSRHGFTERCLALLADEAPGVELWPVRRVGTPAWGDYDAVVFGGPVYFGRWAPSLVRFLVRHKAALIRQPVLAAFVVSLSPRAAAQGYFGRGLPAELSEKLGRVAFFGGAIVWKSLAWWERLLLKRFRGIETDASNLDLGEIQGLAGWLADRSGTKNGVY